MVTERMAKLDRLLALVHALSETTEGLTLDDMAARLGVNRRTAERMRDIILRHFDLEELADDRRKRFLIRESLRRLYTRPSAAEVAALQAEVDGRTLAGQTARAGQLASLLAKVKGALDDREKRRIDPDLDALARLQRTMVTAGPIAAVAPETLTVVQGAILAGCCVEFHYTTEERPEPRWRRVIPYGLVHGPLTYLLGKMPGRDDQPVYFRLDRMTEAKLSETLGCAPDDWISTPGWLTALRCGGMRSRRWCFAFRHRPPPAHGDGGFIGRSGSRSWRTASFASSSKAAACANWPNTCSLGAASC